MQAILVADYSFSPTEYWRSVSQNARQFINSCLTVDPNQRMTAHGALEHPWFSGGKSQSGRDGQDLLPTVKKNFNARRTLHAAIDTIRAINKLREGGAAAMMNGAMSKQPQQAHNPAHIAGNIPAPVEEQPKDKDVKTTADGGDAMDIDGRGHGKGQTQEQIRVQQEKIRQTQGGLWQPRR